MKKTMKMRKARSHRKNKNKTQRGGIFGFSQAEKDEKQAEKTAMGIISQFPENKREQMNGLWLKAKQTDIRNKNNVEKKNLLDNWNRALEFIKSNPDQYAQLQEAEKRREAAIKEGEQLREYDKKIGRTDDDALNAKYQKGVESITSLAMYLIDNTSYSDNEKKTMRNSLNTIKNQKDALPDKIANDINELILIWKSKNVKEITDLTNQYRIVQSEKENASQKELENKLALGLNSGRIHQDSRRVSQGAGGSRKQKKTKRYKRIRSKRFRK
jgi:hypothetical protein